MKHNEQMFAALVRNAVSLFINLTRASALLLCATWHLLSCCVNASQSPISDAAFPLLLERTQTNRQAFYVFRDADSGFNHGFPSGFFGTTSKIHIDTAAINDSNSPSGVSTNLNVIDRQRGNVLQVVFNSFSPGQFAGVNFEEPQGGGAGQIGLGYDLRGASNIVFDVRNPTGNSIRFFFSVAGSQPLWIELPSSTNFGTVTIPIGWFSAVSLTNVHILFSISDSYDLMTSGGSNGGTLLFDNIRFEPNPFSQTNALGLPLSYETFGVVPRTTPATGREPYPPDQVLRNLATPYEAALTLMALLNQGGTTNLAAARVIADTFVYALGHDNHGDQLPATNNAAALHNGYMNGDISLFNNQGTGAGQQGDVRLSGFSCGTSSPTGFCVLLDGATGGNNAFAILALASAFKRFGDTNYLNAARKIGRWVVTYLADNSGTGYGGYFLGYPDEGAPKILIQSKSVENNADIFAALSALAEIERQLGNTAAANDWATNANAAGDFVMQMFDFASGKFFAGTVPVGTPAGTGVTPNGAVRGNDVINTCEFLDANTFTTCALAGSPRYHSQIDWRRPVQYATNHFARTVSAGGRIFKGFGLTTNTISGPDGVAWEFTGQAVVTVNYVDALYGEARFANASSFYLSQIRLAQTNAPFSDGCGVVASTVQDGDLVPPIEQSLSTPFQGIPERVGLAATTWAIFAESSFNPLGQDFGLRITKIKFVATHLHLTFTTYTGHNYRVEGTDSLANNVWQIDAAGIAGNGTEVDVDLGAVQAERRFYRVRRNP